MYVYFNETTASGSVIFVSNETNAIRKEWSLSSSEPRVALTFVKGTYQVVLLSAVDLDVANLGDVCSPPEQFVQRITCYRNGQDPIIHWITFQAQPVNENPPNADTLPDIQISEGNVSLPLFLYPLLDYFKDRDCPKERLVLSISKNSRNKKDVGEYFMINSSTGFLSQVKHFDYEDTEIQCNLGKGGGFVKIIAEDGLYKTSKSLSVTFINIDDAPPVFVNNDCSTVCSKCPILSLSAIVHFTYHGPILTNPPGIKAIDLDTEQSNIIDYNLDIYPTKYKDIIRFENGRFVLLQSFANFSEYRKESDFTVIVTIQATGSNGQTSKKLSFTIYVMVAPISSSQQTSLSQTDEIMILSQSTKNIIIIVLGGVVVLLSVALVYAVYKIRSQQKKAKDGETSYEEVKRNTVTNENVYATIQN